jgi:2-hydroxychromene-2-carboxylate isomerase
MSKTIEFYFDFGSPTAYLAHKRLQQLRQQYEFQLDYRPVLLGGVFKATSNNSPVAIPAKGKYMLEHDLPRFAALYDVELNFNPHFPINTLNLMRGAIVALQQDYADIYLNSVFNAVWVEGKNMGDPEVVAEALRAAGLDADSVLAASQQPDVKASLIANTENAVARGIFGVPTMFIGQQMFFGQDRFQFVEMALQD